MLQRESISGYIREREREREREGGDTVEKSTCQCCEILFITWVTLSFCNAKRQ